MAAKYGSPKMVKALLDGGANPNIEDPQKATPLMRALQELESGDAKHYTPEFRQGLAQVIEELKRHGGH